MGNYRKTSAPVLVAALLSLCGLWATQAFAGPTSSGAANATHPHIAVLITTASNPYWVAIGDGAKAAGKRAGVNVTVQGTTANNSMAQQAQLLETMAGQNYACYVVGPITATNLIQPLTRISAAGKGIVNIDAPLNPDAVQAAKIHVATFIASDNTKAGRLAGQYMAKRLGDKGKVAIIEGIVSNTTSQDRTAGFKAAAEAHGLTVVQITAADWDREKALNAATNILRRHPDLRGFYAANDQMALGVARATIDAGAKNVIVVGTDGDKSALEAIKAGQMAATVAQNPYVEGLLGVDACLAHIRGADLPKDVNSPIELVDSHNVEKALHSYPHPFQPYKNPFAALGR